MSIIREHKNYTSTWVGMWRPLYSRKSRSEWEIPKSRKSAVISKSLGDWWQTAIHVPKNRPDIPNFLASDLGQGIQDQRVWNLMEAYKLQAPKFGILFSTSHFVPKMKKHPFPAPLLQPLSMWGLVLRSKQEFLANWPSALYCKKVLS